MIWHHIYVCKPTFWRSVLMQSAYYSICTLLTHCCRMCHCNEHKLSALQVRRPKKNTAINTTMEQFMEVEHSTTSSQFPSAKIYVCPNVSSNSSRAKKVCTWVWWTPRVNSLELAKLLKNWECTKSTQKKFRFSCDCWPISYLQLLGGLTEQIRVYVTRYDQSA